MQSAYLGNWLCYEYEQGRDENKNFCGEHIGNSELRFSEGQVLFTGHLRLEKIRGGLAAPSGLASCLYSFLGLPTEANRQLQDA